MTDYAERRRSPRIERVELVHVTRYDEVRQRTEQIRGRLMNLSEGGMRLEMNQLVPLGTVVSISLVIGDELLKLEGAVIYVDRLDQARAATGVAFSELDTDTQHVLSGYVRSVAGLVW